MKKVDEVKEETTLPSDKTFINANEAASEPTLSMKIISCVSECSTKKIRIQRSFESLEQQYTDGYFFYIDHDGDVLEVHDQESFLDFLGDCEGKGYVLYYYHPKLELRDNIQPAVNAELCERFKLKMHTIRPMTGDNQNMNIPPASAPLQRDLYSGGIYPNLRQQQQQNANTLYSNAHNTTHSPVNAQYEKAGVAGQLRNQNVPSFPDGVELAGASRSAQATQDSLLSLIQLGLLDRTIFERVLATMIDGIERSRSGEEILQKVVALCLSNAGQLDATTVAIADRFCSNVGPRLDIWLQRGARLVQPTIPFGRTEQRALAMLKSLRKIYQDPRVANRVHNVAKRIIQQALPCLRGLTSGNVDLSLRSLGTLIHTTIGELVNEPDVLALFLEILPVLRDNNAIEDPSMWIANLVSKGTATGQKLTKKIKKQIDKGLHMLGARGGGGLNSALQTAGTVQNMLANPDAATNTDQWNNITSQGRMYGSNLVQSFLSGLQNGMTGNEHYSMAPPSTGPQHVSSNTSSNRSRNHNTNANNNNNNYNRYNNNNNNDDDDEEEYGEASKMNLHMLD